MIRFQDPSLYVKGTCNFTLADPVTGEMKYQDNKFTTNNIQTSVSAEPIRAGLGNTAVAVIPSDTAVNVTATSAAFSLFAKAAQAGAPVEYNAVSPACQTVTAESTTLKIDITQGVPAAQYGYAKPFAYVTEVGKANKIAVSGTAYDIGTDGTIVDFTAETGKTYKVWYYTQKAGAQVAKLSANFDPGVYNAVAQMAVYSNQKGSDAKENGTQVAWLYYVIPFLKMGGNAGLVGDQTTPDTTELSGTALSYDEAVENGVCSDCDMGTLAYYVLVPFDATEGIAGLAIIGGNVSVAVGETLQLPIKYVMEDGALVQPNYTDLKYEVGGPTGTTVSDTGVITAGTTAGTGTVTVTYPAAGDAKFTYMGTLTVEAE